MATPLVSSSPPAWHPDVVFGFPDSETQALSFARAMGLEYRSVALHIFPDGERRVLVPGAAREPIIFRSLHDPDHKLIELILAASVLRREGALSLTLVAPYMAYMRQDIVFHPGEAVSQSVIGGVLAASYDRFVAVDPHLHRTPKLDAVFAEKPALALTAAAAMADHFKRSGAFADMLVVGPDVESGTLVAAFAAVAGLNWVTAVKSRRGDRDVAISIPQDVSVSGRPVIVVDDVISSGATMAVLAKTLKERGARAVDVYATHALFDEAAADAMHGAGIDRIFSCDSVLHPSNAVSLAQTIAEGLKKWR